MDGRVGGWTDGWMEASISELTGGGLAGWIGGSICGWMDGRRDG